MYWRQLLMDATASDVAEAEADACEGDDNVLLFDFNNLTPQQLAARTLGVPEVLQAPAGCVVSGHDGSAVVWETDAAETSTSTVASSSFAPYIDPALLDLDTDDAVSSPMFLARVRNNIFDDSEEPRLSAVVRTLVDLFSAGPSGRWK
jgi:hypothetical protein